MSEKLKKTALKDGKINWKYRSVLALLAGLIFVATLYIINYLTGEENLNLYQLLLEGIIFIVVYWFGIFYFTDYIPRLKNNITPALLQEEVIEREGPANLRRGIEWVGGKLFLTNKRLVFKSHKLNIQKGQTNLALDKIENIHKKTAFPFLKNRVNILMREGKKYHFIITGCEEWIEKLHEKK
jgi:hypothetical protein